MTLEEYIKQFQEQLEIHYLEIDDNFYNKTFEYFCKEQHNLGLFLDEEA